MSGSNTPNNLNNGNNSPNIQPSDDAEEKRFISNLFYFMTQRGTPIEKIPIFDHKELNLYKLYNCVISRGGLEAVIENKLWRQITTDLAVDPERTDAGFRLRIHYLKYLYPYERKHFLKIEDDEQFDYEAFEKHLSKSPADKKTSTLRKKKQQLQNHYNHPSNQHNQQNGYHQHIPLSHQQSQYQQQQYQQQQQQQQSQQPYNSFTSGKSTPSPSSSPGTLLSGSPSSSPHNRQQMYQPQHQSQLSSLSNILSQQQQQPSYGQQPPSPPPSQSSYLSSPNQNNNALNNINNNNNNNNNNEIYQNESILSLYNPTNFNSSTQSNSTSVNLKLLEIKSLKKYNAIHRLKVSHSPSKTELVSAVIQHFAHQNIDEDTIITSFLKRVKSESRIRQLEKV